MVPGPHAGNRNRPAYSGQPRFRFPKQIIQLFAPRPPLEFKPPPRKRKLGQLTGLSEFVSKFDKPAAPSMDIDREGKSPSDSSMPDENCKKNGEAMEISGESSLGSAFETPAQRRMRTHIEREDQVSKLVTEARKAWDPFDDTDGRKTKEPYNTLFVYNIALTTLELQLEEEFGHFGNVRQVIMPKDRDGVPRGYAFVEFERERDAALAMKQAADLRCNGRCLKIDVERGRTVKGWFPNRLDGPFNSATSKIIKHKRETN